MAYPSVNDLLRHLGLTDQNDSVLIADYRAAAIAYIEGPDGAQRKYQVEADTTRTFDAIRDVDGAALLLDHDLISITTLTNGDGATISASAYVLEASDGTRNAAPYRIVRLKNSSGVQWRYLTDPEGAISIIGRWGYSTAAPDRAAQWVREITGWLYRRRAASRDGGDDRAMLTGDGVTLLPSAVPAHIRSQLYRERTVTQ